MGENVDLLVQINDYTIECHKLYQAIKEHMEKIALYKSGGAGMGGDMAE